MANCLSTALIVIPILLSVHAQAADWPQFRHDAGRTAASSQSLPGELHPLWVRKLPAPQPAFPGEIRLRFDASYEPVVLGKTMFVPSMVTDSVTALDTENGNQRWQFFAEGPVRFAPVADQGKVYFVSDDGFLYCLNAGDGSLLWKVRGLPEDQTDRKILGNQRLISLWPARGGPVLANGLLYFAAGLWPSDGVFVHAVDPQSGRIVWSNTDSNQIPKANMDHGIATFAGLTPQGYLAVVGDKLVVPCGAQLPAFLDPKTGALDTYCMGWGGRVGLAKGSWFAAGVNQLLSHSGDLYDLSQRSNEKFRDPRMSDFKSQLYAGTFLRLQIDPKCQRELGEFRQPVFTGESMFVNEDRDTVAYDVTDVKIEPRDRSREPAYRRNDKYPDRVQGTFRERWRLPSPLTVHIKAGNQLFVAGPGKVAAVTIPENDQPPVMTWQTDMPGTPHRLLAADEKLFVVTRDGRLHAFGAARQEPVVTHRPATDAPPPEDEWTTVATKIGREMASDGGFVLILGIAAGRLTEELAAQDKLYVLAVDRDATKVAELRQRLQRRGLYGTKATVLVGDPLTYPLPPYLASLVVSENDAALASPFDRATLESVAHTLRPYGGLARLTVPQAERQALLNQFADQPLPGYELRQDGDSIVLQRRGPLPGAADWSHALADAANSGASQDQALKAPLALLWFDGALRWQRKPGNARVRVAGGQILVNAGSLRALDVYTGRTLWQSELPLARTPGAQLVVLGDEIFVTSGRQCLVFDRVSGRQQKFELPDNVGGAWSNLRVAGQYIVGQSGRQVVCIDRENGNPVWTYTCGRARLSIAVGGGKVFCAELLDRRKGETDHKLTKTRALDLATGRLLWQIDSGSDIRYSEAADRLVTATGVYRGQDGSSTISSSTFDPMHANVPCKPLFIVGRNLLWGTDNSYVAYDLESGAPQGSPLVWVRRGCTGLHASSHLITTRYRGNAAYIDLTTNDIAPIWNVRPACHNNLFPANGVLCAPNLTGGCECNYTPNSQAYAPLSVINRPSAQR